MAESKIINYALKSDVEGKNLKTRLVYLANGSSVDITADSGVVFPTKNTSDTQTVGVSFAFLSNTLKTQGIGGAYTSSGLSLTSPSSGTIRITNNSGAYVSLIIIYK